MAVIDEVKILVRAEVDKAIADMNKTEKETNNLRKSFKDLRDVMTGPVAAAKDVAAVFGKVIDATMGLYNEFADAELAAIKLNAAIANSENVTPGAEQRLSAFADELQSVSIFEGDATKAIIANLAAMGKSESQIKQLVSAASNLASATGVDLDTAIAQLNATLQGNAGILGRQNGAVRALTTEQLKNGEAIRIVSEQYAGFADKVGKSASGSVVKLSNNFGDLKETIGETIAISFKPLVNGLDDAVQSTNKILQGQLITTKFISGQKLSRAELVALEESLNEQVKETNKSSQRGASTLNGIYKDRLKQVQDQIKGMDQAEYVAARMGQTAKEQNAVKEKEAIKAAEIADTDKKRNDIIEKTKKSVSDMLKDAEFEYNVRGKDLDQGEIKNKILDEAKNILISSNGLVTKESKIYKDLIALAGQFSDETKKGADAKEEELPTQESMTSILARNLAIAENNANESERTRQEVEKWADEAEGVDYIMRNISTAIAGNTDEAKKFSKVLGDGFEIAGNVAGEFGNLVKNIQDQELKGIEDKNAAYLAGIEQEIAGYEEGSEAKKSAEERLVQEKERIAKEEKEIKNKYGKEAFEGQKALSIAQATINGAVSAVKALELGPIAGPIAAAVIAGLTGAQIGLIASQNYVPMAQGGVVTTPTRALIGENGPEAVIPLRGNNQGLGNSVTIVQNVAGSVVTEKYLTAKAMQAVALSARGY